MEQHIAKKLEELQKNPAVRHVLLVDKKGGLHDFGDMIIIDAYKATDDEFDDLEFATDDMRRAKARALKEKLDERV